MRDLIVAGNWKMNGSQSFADSFIRELNAVQLPGNVRVLVCPPAVYLKSCADNLNAALVGAQNVHAESSGAFTGELAAEMLKDVGCQYVLVGHSERRTLFAETDEIVAAKVASVLKAGMTPVLCVGETLAEREAGDYLALLNAQLQAGLATLSASEFADVVVAYEPVWAIGTGKTASPAQAQEVHASLRAALNEIKPGAGEEISILYGGSVNAANAAELFACSDIDGGLVGGASLKIDDFLAICSAAAESR